LNDKSKPMFTISGKIWIENETERVLGSGRIELLERVRASGSIRQAALQMKMSYKQAWDMVNHMNDHFSSAVVISQRGGKGGGQAIVTDHGLKVIDHFHQLDEKFRAFLATADLRIDL
jgi:molybdate transport system regulatory protein